MTRLSLTLCLLLPASEAFGGVVYTVQFKTGDKPMLGVHKGKPRGLDWGFDWDLSTKGLTEIQVREPGESKGWFLAYDPKGKAKGEGEGEVSLADERGDGTRWRVTRTEDEGVERYTIQAESGRYKGWYLCVEDKGVRVKPGKGAKGKEAKVTKAYRLYLAENPKKLPRVEIGMISP